MEVSNEVTTDPQRLEMALKESKETTLNGHIIEDHETKSDGCISVSDIKLKVNEVCQLCGKMWMSENEKEEEKNSNGIVKHNSNGAICEECITPTEMASDHQKVVESENKRDSGFHTLKRFENDKPAVDTGQQNPDVVLSNASSADSAVSMGACIAVDHTVNEEIRPSIVVDECDSIDTPTHKHLDLSDNVFEDNRKVLYNNDASPKKETPESLAQKLFKFDGYKRTEIARVLGKNSEYHREVAKSYLQYFNFADSSLVDAYRQFLSHFALLGETQERERILLYFSERYLECNPEFLDHNIDSVHTLICAVTLLNTDLHGNVGLSSGRKKMTYKQFSFNLSGLMSNSEDYPKDLLASLYNSVKKHPLPWGGKEPKKVPRSMSMRHGTETEIHRPSGKVVNRSLSTRSPLKPGKSPVEAPQAGLGRSAKTKSLSHTHGLLWRKLYLDCEGKKVSIGKRGWKVYTVTLQNLELHAVKKGSTEAKTVSIHHCLAEETRSDSKRQYVFRVTHADASVTLYQANSDKEVRKWVRDINKAAAMLSAAPLCSPVGSQLVFRRALLPSAPSTLPPSNQLKKLHELLKEHEQDLSETQKMAETERASSEQRQKYYQDKISYLKSEIRKYDCYVKILQMHIRTTPYPEESNSNLDSDNGSLVSVTPSEPPLASPSALDTSENLVFMDSIATADSVLSPPAHLAQSPQVRNLTLSPTSSLPNLSPILESPAKVIQGGNQPPGSLKRRRRKDLYESSLNGIAPPSPRNTNNSNRVESTPNSHLREVRAVGPSAHKVGIETTVVGMQTLPRNQEPFPVKRYEMRIADMAPEYESPSTPPDNPTPTFEPRTRLIGGSSISDASATEIHLRPQVENMTLSRVKGRNEKRGIDRYSYMQAVSPYGEI